ncbi:pseudouridine synthase [Chlamydiota bacterium]
MEKRLQKVLAEAGLGSRRKCEDYIKAGRIDVNKNTVKELGSCIDLDKDIVTIDGEKLTIQKKQYFAFNKPRGVVCSSSDTLRRPRVIDVFDTIDMRLFTVGRLDVESEGLIFVTNDGAFSHAVLHPRSKTKKTYLIQLDRLIRREDCEKIKKGIWFDGKRSLPAEITYPIKNISQKSQLKVTITEGRKRQLRRMFLFLGYRVKKLKRIKIGTVSLGRLKPGCYRKLSRNEINYFIESL